MWQRLCMVFVKFIFTEMMFDGHDDPFFKQQISFFDERIHSGKAIQGSWPWSEQKWKK